MGRDFEVPSMARFHVFELVWWRFEQDVGQLRSADGETRKLRGSRGRDRVSLL